MYTGKDVGMEINKVCSENLMQRCKNTTHTQYT